jgi:hypothetical protein
MTTKERLRKLRAECADWDLIIANFTMHGMSKRDAELGILSLVDLGLVRIEPRARGPFTALVLTIPDGIPEEVLSSVEK